MPTVDGCSEGDPYLVCKLTKDLFFWPKIIGWCALVNSGLMQDVLGPRGIPIFDRNHDRDANVATMSVEDIMKGVHRQSCGNYQIPITASSGYAGQSSVLRALSLELLPSSSSISVRDDHRCKVAHFHLNLLAWSFLSFCLSNHTCQNSGRAVVKVAAFKH